MPAIELAQSRSGRRGGRGYRAKQAQAKADSRAREKAERRRKVTSEIWEDAKRRLADGWTFDNGKEFALFKAMEQALGLKVYFAKPYHSWERGTNENRNGVVRKVLPKGRSFDGISEGEMRPHPAKRRSLRLKPALQTRPKSAILPTKHKKALVRLPRATGVALEIG